MWEFEIEDIETGEHDIIHGLDFEDACNRANIDVDSVILVFQEYVD